MPQPVPPQPAPVVQAVPPPLAVPAVPVAAPAPTAEGAAPPAGCDAAGGHTADALEVGGGLTLVLLLASAFCWLAGMVGRL